MRLSSPAALLVRARASRQLASLLRALPVVLAVALLYAAARPAARDTAAPAPVPDALVYPNCTSPLQGPVVSDTSWVPPRGGGVTQPVFGPANMAACSIGVVPGWHYGGTATARVVQWDPVALAPDPTTVALRTITYGVSGSYLGRIYFPFVPPIVGRRLPGLAEAPGAETAIDLLSDIHTQSYYPDLVVQYARSANPDCPAGYLYDVTGGPRYALPGARGAVQHEVCGGDGTLQDLYVVQGVTTCSSVVPFFRSYDVLQRFQVPQECQVRWVEVACNDTAANYLWGGGAIGILDGAGLGGAPPPLTSPLVSAAYSPPRTTTWTSHVDFDRVITLEPNHDYWVWVADHYGMGLEARALTGGESAAFTSAIGPLVVRNDYNADYSTVPGRVLAFKLIGVPLGAVGVAPPLASPAFSLRAGPNPAHGPVMLAWSGAKGAVRIDVLDARGRRVGGGAAGGAGAGQWLWSAARTGGGQVAPGVYFVRARDAAGAVASERVVVTR